MAYWHDRTTGEPCPPFRGRFDWWHLWPLLPVAAVGAVRGIEWLLR